MKARNEPSANNPICHANDSSNAAAMADIKQPTDKHAIANPLVKISTMINTKAATTQICQISIILFIFDDL